jgi:hypothetical protein
MPSIRSTQVRIARRMGLAAAAVLMLGVAVEAKTQGERKPDLADAVAGAYHGDVVSDSQGSSREGVSLTLTRVGPNEVSISSDYSRLPVTAVRLERALSQIVNRGGSTSFVYNAGKLDVSFNNEVSWSGHR